MREKVKRVLIIISFIIIIIGLVLGILTMNEQIFKPNKELYVDGTDFSVIANLLGGFTGSFLTIIGGLLIIIFSVIIDLVIWIIYGITLAIINKKQKK